jgi:hypothetical protein
MLDILDLPSEEKDLLSKEKKESREKSVKSKENVKPKPKIDYLGRYKVYLGYILN